MGLAEIAAGLELIEKQRDRGVATRDDTDVALVDRFRAHEEELPCTPEAATTIIEATTPGTSVGSRAREAGVAPITAAKVLHRCGVEGVTPLTPLARRVLDDWLAGDLSRVEALELTGATEAEFALATYIATHEPIPELAEARQAALTPRGNATVEKRDALAETMSDASDLL